MKTPVLFITFNRLDTTKQVFEQIKKVKPIKLYLASDGPRENVKGEREKVEEIRRYVLNNIDWNCKVKTLFRDKNLGPKYLGELITWFFKDEENGIILEHDCVPSQDFFTLCDELLEYYKNNNKIGMISGFNPFSEEVKVDSSFFFSKYNICWGWATWKRVWDKYDVEMKDWLNNKWILDSFTDKFLVKQYWKNIFNVAYYDIDYKSWDGQFSYLMFKDRMLTIVPAKNLIKNIGYGVNTAVHCIEAAPEHIEKAALENLNFPLKYPEILETNKKWDELIEKIHFRINFFTVFKLKIKVLLGKSQNKSFYNLVKKIYKRIK